MCCMVYDGTSWQMSRSLPMFALVFVSRGVNTSWMTPSASKNSDAVFFFFFRKWQTLNILVLGEVECFRCIRACFVWGAEWCPHVSSPVAMYFQELVDFLALPADISVSSLRTICSIPVLRGHCRAQFWWTTPVLRIFPVVACLFFQNQVSSLVLRPHVLGRPVRLSSRMAVRPSTNSLQHFLTCWILITPYLYTPKDWRWILGEKRLFAHENQINIRILPL